MQIRVVGHQRKAKSPNEKHTGVLRDEVDVAALEPTMNHVLEFVVVKVEHAVRVATIKDNKGAVWVMPRSAGK